MGSETTNYKMFKPAETDSMADVKKNITDNLTLLEARANPTIIAAGAALPQSGSYEVGDRVFRADAVTSSTYPSSYMLVCKDAIWGWHWRPIQQIMSPWINLPAGIINDAAFEIHPTHPVAIAFDSRGWMHWRGAFRKTTANIAEATNFTVLKPLPVGLRPHLRHLEHLPVSPVVSGSDESGFVGGRVYINELGVSNFRFYNTNNATSQVFWMTGIRYQPSKVMFYGA